MVKCKYDGCDKRQQMKTGECQAHNNQKKLGNAKARVERKTERQGDCIVWNGHLDTSGYPSFKYMGETLLVHRQLYKEEVRDIASAETIDHTCRNKLCLNLDHLDVVSRTENLKRMQLAREYESKIETLLDFIESLGYNRETLLPKD